MAKSAQVERLELDEKKFRYLLNDNAMATGENGRRYSQFAADVVKLEKLVASKLRSRELAKRVRPLATGAKREGLRP